ncbi:MAG TPA: transposase [Desulfatiglandales bacterium]|nr:transposase [Desulfatiglandales bacterium]
MTRPWRIEYEGAYYHVLSRGNERKDIFYGDKDRKLFVDTLGEVSDRFSVDIFAFVFMSNHYHVLLRTNRANLSKAMQWLGVTYTRRFNNAYGRSGHLFEGRFKSIVVENDAYVLELSCYIHRNPLRAGIAKRLVDYPWSSYPVYAYGRKGPDWLKTDLIRSFFSDEDYHKAYREKVQRYAGEENRLWEDFRHGVIMGTQQFVDRVKSRYVSERPHREIPQQRGLVGRIDATMLLNKASQLLKCDVEWFREAGRLYGKDKENRDLLVYLLWERGAFTNGEIGDFFGVTYTAVSHIVKKVKGQFKTDRDYRQKYDLVYSQIKM